MAFPWHAYDGPTLNAGLVVAIFQGIPTCIARKPYIFVIFQGGGGGGSGPPVPLMTSDFQISTLANSEGKMEMLHNMAFLQGIHLLRQTRSSGKEIQFYLKIGYSKL